MKLERLVPAGLVAGLVGAALTLAACGSGANLASAAGSSKPSQTAGGAPAQAVTQVVHENMTIETGRMLHKPGWPKFTPSSWTVKNGDTVIITIQSYDDGTAPLPANSPYAKVQGTVGGTELVDGQAISSLPVDKVAHTFTVPGLGINLVIPAAPKGGTVTVQATVQVTKAGVFNWQCEAPCGTGQDGWGGPMVTPGWMEGTITVA